LCAATHDDDRFVRMTCLAVLGTLGKGSVPTLRAGLKDEDPCVRSHAIEALENIGKDAEDALPDLLHLQEKDCTNHVRESAQQAVMVIRAAGLGPPVK
jgi:HEAT repeat protein